jgi:hypothetical protein
MMMNGRKRSRSFAKLASPVGGRSSNAFRHGRPNTARIPGESVKPSRPEQEPTRSAASHVGVLSAPKQNIASTDLIEIPGLPIEVAPLHIHALKLTVKYLKERKNHSTIENLPIPPYDTSEQPSDHDPIVNRSVSQADHSSGERLVDAILKRMDDSRESQRGSPNVRSSSTNSLVSMEQKQRDAVRVWFQSICRCVRDEEHYCKNQQLNERNQEGGTTCRRPKSVPTGVPVAALRHLFSLACDDNRLVVRRSALHCAGKLLLKSADCRKWFLNDENHQGDNVNRDDCLEGLEMFVKWMDCVCENPVNEDSSTAQNRFLWQQEAGLLLVKLVEEGYGEFYPTLLVGLSRFQQLCPRALSIDTSKLRLSRVNEVGQPLRIPPSSSASSSLPSEIHLASTLDMATLRKYRDAALSHIVEEETRVLKLLQRAYACIDVLVPSIFHGQAAAVGEQHGAETDANQVSIPAANIDEAEDDEIDWEDGWETRDSNDHASHAEEEENIFDGAFDQPLSSQVDRQHQRMLADVPSRKPEADSQKGDSDHLAAVEQTIEAMRATNGVTFQHSGTLEIDFTTVPEASATNVPSPARESARSRLQKTVNLLLSRHIPRLRVWSEGLTWADQLEQPSPEQRVLVKQTDTTARERQQTLDRVSELNLIVKRLVDSCQRLLGSDGNASLLESLSSDLERARPRPRLGSKSPVSEEIDIFSRHVVSNSTISRLTNMVARGESRARVLHNSGNRPLGRSTRIRISYRK